MRVLVIPAWYDENENLASFILDQTLALQKNKVEQAVLLVYIVSKGKLIQRIFQPATTIKNKNGVMYITVRFFSLFPFQFLRLYRLQSYFIKRKVLNAIKKYQNENGEIDLIHFQSVCNNLMPQIGAYISNQLKKPYIITEHYTTYEKGGEYIFSPFSNQEEAKQIVQNSALNLSVSAYAAKLHSDYFNAEFKVLPNMVPELFETNLSEELKSTETFTFISIGAMSERKGMNVLVKAFVKAFRLEDKVKLILVGEGELKQEIQNDINLNKRQQQIITYGKLTRHEILNLMDQSHVLVSASNNETFGLTIVEGFFRGLPAIVTNSGGPVDFMTHENGYLCDAGSENSLMEKLILMLKNYKAFNAQLIREIAVQNFSQKVISDRVRDAYKVCLSNTIHEKSD